jgi:hypothetical protein
LLTSKASLLLNDYIRDFGSLTKEIKVLANRSSCSTSIIAATEGIIIQSIVRLVQLIA